MRSFVLRKMAVMGVVIVMLVFMCFLNGVKQTKETLIRVGFMWFYMRMRIVTLMLMNRYFLTAGECLAGTGHSNSHFFSPPCVTIDVRFIDLTFWGYQGANAWHDTVTKPE